MNIYIFCGCPSWFFHGCPVLQICHIVAPTCLFSPLNILFQLDSVPPPLFSLRTVFMWSFCLLLFFSCFTLLLFIFISLLVFAVAHLSFKFSCLQSGAVEIFILQAYCAVSLSLGAHHFETVYWPHLQGSDRSVVYIRVSVQSHSPITFHRSTCLVILHRTSDPWRGGHWVLGNKHPVTEQYLSGTKVLSPIDLHIKLFLCWLVKWFL